MRIRTCWIGLAAAGAMASAALAEGDPIVVDFEFTPAANALSDGDHVTDQFLAWGVTFSSTDSAGPVIRERSFDGMSGANALSGYNGDPNTNAFQPIIMDFDMAIESASIVGLDIGQAGLKLTAYGEDEELIDEMTVAGSAQNTFATLSVSGQDIWRLEVSQINPGFSGDGYMIDDLSFTPQDIPAPAAGAMLVIAGLCGRRRRRSA